MLKKIYKLYIGSVLLIFFFSSCGSSANLQKSYSNHSVDTSTRKLESTTFMYHMNLTKSDRNLFSEVENNNNTIFEINEDIDLNNKSIKLPSNSVFNFDGGRISCGTIIINSSDCRFIGGNFKDVVFIVSNSTVEFMNCEFSNNDIKKTVINARQSNLSIKKSKFNCICDYMVKCSSNGQTNTSLYIEDSRFNGQVSTYTVEYSACQKESVTSTAIINNVSITAIGNVYEFHGLNYVSIHGGEFSGGYSNQNGNEYTCNVYSCLQSEIIGGYYHDMGRGATIGGPDGQNGRIIGTINVNLTYCGICVDLAKGTSPESYSDGFVIVEGNTVVNSGYGMYIQGRNIIISNNTIKGGTNSNKYGIRINGNIEEDNNIIVQNNIVDYTGQDVYPIFCGQNVNIKEKNNIFYSNYCAIAGYSSAEVSQDRYYVLKNNVENIDVTEYDIVEYPLSMQSSGAIRLYITSNNISIKGKRIVIINNSQSYLDISDFPKGSETIGETRIESGNIAVVYFITNEKRLIQNISSVPYGSSDNRPKNVLKGFNFFDSTLNMPIWWDGKKWVDSSGKRI